jgi:hypothetical protein
MPSKKLLISIPLLLAAGGCVSVEQIRSKEPVYVAVYAGQNKAFTTCTANNIIERQAPTIIFDEPNKTSTLSTWTVDVHGRHLLNEATIVESEPGKQKVELRAWVGKTIWGTTTQWTDDFVNALDKCGRKLS